MSVNDVLQEAINVCSNLKKVKTGDKANPEDYNQLVDCVEKLLELAFNIGLSGKLPDWVPILDIGKLDYMIVGEPRKDVTLTPISDLFYLNNFEIKPIYGYLFENDIKRLALVINSESKYKDLQTTFPYLKFGEKLTSDYLNQLYSYIWNLARDSGLPHRFITVNADNEKTPTFKIGINYKPANNIINLVKKEVIVRVK